MKKRVICFGDSNTWGYNPANGSRYDENTRWPMVLQKLLGDAYQIIEEGQNGRTIANADPWEWGCKCGMDYIIPMVESQKPFDLLIIMLGSNDLKAKFHLPAGDIAGSLQNMLMKTKSFLHYQCGIQPKILIVSPPYIGDGLASSPFAPFFDTDTVIENSRQLAHWYELVAKQFDCEFMDAAAVCRAGEADSLHLTEEGHRKLAEGIYSKLREMEL
ncbi:MAG: SGNH/GDSL hydrolase family protein [Lachnospiraceae bacterium]|nr:SGNH/GDSL hydrolase family protein [Lachnospiraceae bacterium]